MDADALAPCVTKPSSAMALTMQGKRIILFHKKGFQLPASLQYKWKKNEFISYVLKKTSLKRSELVSLKCFRIYRLQCHHRLRMDKR